MVPRKDGLARIRVGNNAMREIKFRAFHKERKKFYFFGTLVYCDEYNHLGFDLINHEVDGGPYCNIDSKTDDFENIQQYIGLKDKNGKEIYEGDIVLTTYISLEESKSELSPIPSFSKVKNKKEIVELKGGGFFPFTRLWAHGNEDFIKFTEVIGNIYENKELLVKNG